MDCLLFTIIRRDVNNMAVYKDKERGTWYFTARVKQLDGNTKQVKRRGFKTKKEATIAEAKAITSEPQAADMLFKDLAEKYIEWYAARRKQSSTNKITSVLRIHLIPKFGEMKLADIRPSHVTNFQTDLIGKYSGNHAKRICTTLTSTFSFGVRNEYTKDNPSRMVGTGEIQLSKRIDYWALDEFKKFIKHVDDFTYYTLFMTLYYSGMRKGELLALTWKDIDFENNKIDINKTEYQRQITTPKTAASTRKIVMPEHTMSLLDKLKKDTAVTVPLKSHHVVFGEVTTSIATSTLDDNYNHYVKLSKVNRIRLHDFRHSHASYLINRGAIISVVAKRLGHSDVATTLNTYNHLYPSTEDDIVSLMEDDFKKAKILKLLP